MKRVNMWCAMALIAVLAAPSAALAAEKVTFSKDVLPILQENCQVCHRPSGKNMSGMIAPMSLLTYQEVRPWAKAIARVVDSKEMPPWHASPDQHGVFDNERTMTEEQIAMIVAWAKSGAQRGNPADAPEPIEFMEGWSMGEPDLVVEMDEPYFVADEVEDLYHNLHTTISADLLSEDKWVQAIEFIPGSEAVHHIIAYAAAPGADTVPIEDGVSVEENPELLRGRSMLGGLAPGTDPGEFPAGYGVQFFAGSEVAFEMHYHKEAGPGTGVWDNSLMALKFHEKPVEHEVLITPIAHGAFEIPPFHPNWVVSGATTTQEDITILSLMPHLHLRGIESKYTAFYPDGTSEVLLHTPDYDFNWQTSYSFEEPKKIPAGTRIEFEMVYDNSTERAEWVGFNPARAIHFGGPTTDEMDLGWYSYAVDGDIVGSADD